MSSFPRLSIGLLPISSLLIVSTLFVSGCSGPTPKESFGMALDKIQNQKPPDYLGATLILKGLIKNQSPDMTAELRRDSYIMLSEIYSAIDKHDQSAEYCKDCRDDFGLDTEEGQACGELYVRALIRSSKLDDALKEAQAMLERTDIPKPRQTQLRLHEATVLGMTGEKEESREKFFEMALEFDDKMLERTTLESYVASHSQDSPTSAAEAYLRFVEAKPESALAQDAEFGAAFYFLQAGEKEKAEPYLEKYFEQQKLIIKEMKSGQEKIGKQTALARAYELAGRHDEERSLYKTIAKENKDEMSIGFGALKMAAVSHFRQMEFDEGQEVLALIQEYYPNSEAADMASQMASNMITQKARIEKIEAEQASKLKEAEEKAGEATSTEEAPAVQLGAPAAIDTATSPSA